jgi:hypothetical protein
MNSNQHNQMISINHQEQCQINTVIIMLIKIVHKVNRLD